MHEIPDYLRSPTCWSLFFASIIATAVLTPWVMRLAGRVDAVDAGGHRRVSDRSRPLLGGLGIIVPFLAVCAMGFFGLTGMFGHIEAWQSQFLMLAVGGLAIGTLGFLDDTCGVRIRYRLLVETAVALLVVMSGDVLESFHLPLVGEIAIGREVGIVLGVAWIVGFINAMNLIDGVDGLATGVSLVATIGLAVLGAIDQHTFVVLLCIALAGNLIGFLPYNLPQAKIFLGDTGSMFLGFVLATITWMSAYDSPTPVMVIGPLLVLGFPIFETLLTITRRLVHGAPVFGADDRHIHHRLLDRGFSKNEVLFLLFGVSGVLISVAIMTRILPGGSQLGWIGLAIVIATLTTLGWLAGYLRTVRVEHMVMRRQRNATRNAFARYASLSLSAHRDLPWAQEVLELGRRELGLSYLAVWLGEPAVQILAPGSVAGESPREHLRFKSPKGEWVAIEFEFIATPDEEERRDVAGCLAQLFEQESVEVTLSRPYPVEIPP